MFLAWALIGALLGVAAAQKRGFSIGGRLCLVLLTAVVAPACMGPSGTPVMFPTPTPPSAVRALSQARRCTDPLADPDADSVRSRSDARTIRRGLGAEEVTPRRQTDVKCL
jgi:hypothetical protein